MKTILKSKTLKIFTSVFLFMLVFLTGITVKADTVHFSNNMGDVIFSGTAKVTVDKYEVKNTDIYEVVGVDANVEKDGQFYTYFHIKTKDSTRRDKLKFKFDLHFESSGQRIDINQDKEYDVVFDDNTTLELATKSVTFDANYKAVTVKFTLKGVKGDKPSYSFGIINNSQFELAKTEEEVTNKDANGIYSINYKLTIKPLIKPVKEDIKISATVTFRDTSKDIKSVPFTVTTNKESGEPVITLKGEAPTSISKKGTRVEFDVNLGGNKYKSCGVDSQGEGQTVYHVNGVNHSVNGDKAGITCLVRVDNDSRKPKCILLVTVNYETPSGETKHVSKTFEFSITKITNEEPKEPTIGDDDDDGSNVYGDPDDLLNILSIHSKEEREANPEAGGLGDVIYDFAKVIAAILTFACTIFIGANIVFARSRAEERSSSMQGLMYVAIGVLILSLVFEIYTMIAGFVGDPESELPEIASREVIVEEYKM